MPDRADHPDRASRRDAPSASALRTDGSGAAAGRAGGPVRSAGTRLYDRWARLYDGVARHAPGVRRLRARAVDALRLERGDVVLEVGCGTGANLPLLARAVGPTGRVVGIDLAPGSLSLARRYACTYPQVEVLRGDATAPPLERVDAVLGTFVVGMLEDPGAAVETWSDLVGDGGHVALLHLRRSEHLASPLVNPALELLTRLSAPPTTQLRYDPSLSPVLDRRVRDAHAALRARADATVTESHWLDLVELAGGRFE